MRTRRFSISPRRIRRDCATCSVPSISKNCCVRSARCAVGQCEALTGLRRVCPDIRFLGSYPRADRGPAADQAEREARDKDSVYRDAAAWLGRIRNGKL